MIEVKGKYNTAKIFTDKIEETAYGQILELCNQKAFKDTKIRIMPDTHAGKGCVIGFTAQLKERVVPNLIGVDIGCGMTVTELGHIDIDFKVLDEFIRNHVPHGNSINQTVKASGLSNELMENLSTISSKTGTVLEKHMRSLGSLGGGNHFIEINEDSQGNKYLVIHSGSRNLGLQVAKYHQKRAEEYCENKTNDLRNKMNKEVGLLKQSMEFEKIQSAIDKYEPLFSEYRVPKALMFLEGEQAEEYLVDMYAAQEFAMWNRKTMSNTITNFLGLKETNGFTSVHNYINPNDKVIRKGAISAMKGEKVIIPINMRDGSIIAIGKGNEDWNNSAPHGAGRLMSRSKAKECLTMEEFKNTMQEVWSSSVGEATLDEAPMAYKPIEDILNNVTESLEIIEVIKPLYNFKASN